MKNSTIKNRRSAPVHDFDSRGVIVNLNLETVTNDFYAYYFLSKSWHFNLRKFSGCSLSISIFLKQFHFSVQMLHISKKNVKWVCPLEPSMQDGYEMKLSENLSNVFLFSGHFNVFRRSVMRGVFTTKTLRCREFY